MEELAFQLGGLLVLLLVGYGVGRRLEANHYRSIREREQATASMTVVPLQRLPGLDGSTDRCLVTGGVVVSVDYFKSFVAGLRKLFGGRLSTYETLLDRGRREAVLRMKEEAQRLGYDTIICVRVETSRLASAGANGKGTAGVEIFAFGTAVRLGA
ncbi:MAG: heavy metal-binding domain-containing protein [Myxococcota bacterium]